MSSKIFNKYLERGIILAGLVFIAPHMLENYQLNRDFEKSRVSTMRDKSQPTIYFGFDKDNDKKIDEIRAYTKTTGPKSIFYSHNAQEFSHENPEFIWLEDKIKRLSKSRKISKPSERRAYSSLVNL